MIPQSANLRGILLMVLATGVFVTNDTFMKLATEGLPPLEVLFMRGVSATLWCIPLLFITGNVKHVKKLADKWTLLRSIIETLSVLCFVIALANMPIADITALGQTAPMLMLLGIGLIYHEKIGALRMSLIVLGFAGAVLVAQPGASGISIYAVLGFVQAALTGLRDIVLRKIPSHVPALIVTFSTVTVVTVGAGIATTLFEHWTVPTGRHLLLLAGAGLFMMLGQLFISMAYRTGATAVVAPFYYMFAVWAVISGALVFHTVPNALAIVGIVLILASGVTIVMLDERRRRLLVTA